MGVILITCKSWDDPPSNPSTPPYIWNLPGKAYQETRLDPWFQIRREVEDEGKVVKGGFIGAEIWRSKTWDVKHL